MSPEAAANVHSLDARRNAAATEPPSSEFEQVSPEDLAPADEEPTAADLAAIAAEELKAQAAAGETPDDEPAEDDPADEIPEPDPEDKGPCTACNGDGTITIDGDEWEACVPCGGSGREGAQTTLGLDGAGDAHVATGQARMFAADAYDDVTSGSRLGGRRATTGKVAISGASVDALKLDQRNRIPKGATIRLEVVGTVMFVGDRDKIKDGFHAGTTREHSVKASHVQVVSWMHDEDGLRWDEDHGLREKVNGQWRKVADAPAVEPEADAEPTTGPGFGTATDETPEGVPDAEPDTGSDDVPTELPATTEPEPTPDPEPEAAPAKPKRNAKAAAAVILGRPETYTPDALGALKKDELREVLDDLGVSGVPARIDRDTLLTMALTAAGHAPT